MDNITICTALFLGVIEGLTEFFPISSTGHLILASEILSISGEKAKLFEVVIQLGAILAVIWIYREKILALFSIPFKYNYKNHLGINILVAFFPAALVGLVMHKTIKKYLFGSYPVAVALVIGGFIMLLIEKRTHKKLIETMDNITLRAAFGVGLFQIFALFPGVSRAAATIMGGLLIGMDRKVSTEFSFFLAIPTIFAATVFDLASHANVLSISDLKIISIGFIASFFSALLVIRWFINFVSNHNFKPFAYYRIIFGSIFLGFFLLNK